MTGDRIEKVINLKNLTKEQLEAEVRQKREELRIENEKLERLENQINETINSFFERQNSGPVDAKELNIFHDYLACMERQLTEQKKIVHNKRNILREKEKEVIKVFRDKKLLEILRDNTIKAELRESLLREQKDMDLDFIIRRLKM